MLTASAEAELRAIASLARGCERLVTSNKVLFAALADRMDTVLEQYGEAAWRRRTGQLPIIAAQ